MHTKTHILFWPLSLACLLVAALCFHDLAVDGSSLANDPTFTSAWYVHGKIVNAPKTGHLQQQGTDIDPMELQTSSSVSAMHQNSANESGTVKGEGLSSQSAEAAQNSSANGWMDRSSTSPLSAAKSEASSEFRSGSLLSSHFRSSDVHQNAATSPFSSSSQEHSSAESQRRNVITEPDPGDDPAPIGDGSYFYLLLIAGYLFWKNRLKLSFLKSRGGGE